MREFRDGKGRWRRFPFHYSVLALTEAGGAAAATELRYAAPGLERILNRRGGSDRFARRRRIVAERALEMI